MHNNIIENLNIFETSLGVLNIHNLILIKLIHIQVKLNKNIEVLHRTFKTDISRSKTRVDYLLKIPVCDIPT